jgi:hypothetical protein
MALSWPAPKDPDEVKDYGINWAQLLGADTISTSAWSVTPVDNLTIGVDSKTTNTTTVWLSGGTVGTSYQVQNRVVTTGGRTYDRTVKLKMKTL